MITAKIRRQNRIRAKAKAVSSRPRLHVFRSLRYFSLQLIDDSKGITLASVHEKSIDAKDKAARLQKLGEEMASRIKKAGITEIYLDRGAYAYHGRLSNLVEVIRKTGIKF